MYIYMRICIHNIILFASHTIALWFYYNYFLPRYLLHGYINQQKPLKYC